MMTRECEGHWYAFAAAIYDDCVYVINVDDSTNPVTVGVWAHNIWVDNTCEVAYAAPQLQQGSFPSQQQSG
jgi:hypothetical protein